MGRVVRGILLLSLLIGTLFWMPGGITAVAPPPARAQEGGALRTDGNLILDPAGNPVIITGISWFGLETENFAPHGLWARSLESFLDQIVELGFNTIRLPYSSQLFDPSSQPTGINYDLNPDLVGLNGLEIMDRVIAGAGERGLKVILDRHRPDSHAQSELWYTPQVSEERWIADWVMLAERYAGDDTVIGADLHNEPHGAATWGSGDEATDWRLAAERAGNAILEANPNLLIIVQGVEKYQEDYYWWGGNLMGVAEHPVRLSQPDRLVYSPHTYGPGVYPQPWFNDPSFPDNMPEIWDRHWGYVHKQGLAPVMLGEFGGRSVQDDREGIWQRALVSYLKENGISYIYWTLNPNSGDTGGVLLDDWQTVDPDKQELLASYQAPLIGSGGGGVETGASATPAAAPPATEPPASATPVPTAVETAAPPLEAPTGLSVRYHTSNPAEASSDSKPEFIIANGGQAAVNLEHLELVYWFSDDPGESHNFQCDWAQIGCENVLGEFEYLSDGNYALHIRFKTGAGVLSPGQESGEIKLRFNRENWSEFDQADDYSFATPESYEETERVGLYVNGALVSGRPPDGAAVSPTIVPPTTSAKPAPEITPTPVASDAGRQSQGWLTMVIAMMAAAVAGFVLAVFWLGRRRGG
jgi:endoglucanase